MLMQNIFHFSVSYVCKTDSPNQKGKISVYLNLKEKAGGIYARNKMKTCGTANMMDGKPENNSFVIPDTSDTNGTFRYMFEIDTSDADQVSACGIQMDKEVTNNHRGC